MTAVGSARAFGLRVCDSQTMVNMAAFVRSYAVEPATWAFDRGFHEATSWRQIRDHMDGVPALPSSLLFAEHWGWLTWPLYLIAETQGRVLMLAGDIPDASDDENNREYDGPWPRLATLDSLERLDELCGARSNSPWVMWLSSPDVPTKYLARALGGMLK